MRQGKKFKIDGNETKTHLSVPFYVSVPFAQSRTKCVDSNRRQDFKMPFRLIPVQQREELTELNKKSTIADTYAFE